MKNYLLIFLFFPIFLSAQETDKILNIAEEMPRFPGCEEIEDLQERKECSQKEMLLFIYKNIKYPALARENGTEGTTVIQFIISKDGSISNPKIMKDLADGCGQEALRVIKLMNTLSDKWIPGKQEGQAVNVRYTLPINYRLSVNETPPPPVDTTIYKEVDALPRFPGCEDIADMAKRKACAQTKMLEFLYRNLRYPAKAREDGIEGTVVVRFIVLEDGSIYNPTIIRSIGDECDQEVLRIIESMKDMPEKWIPAEHEGKNVKCYYNLPVKFRLESRKKIGRKKRRRN